MFRVSVGPYTLRCLPVGLPDIYSDYVQHATLAEEINLQASGGENCCLAVSRGAEWPYLVIAQRYAPAGFGFEPGVLLLPETDRLFLGAGERLLCYDLEKPERMWEDSTDVGFWHWDRYGGIVLMAAELEFAAWDVQGQKLWTTFVEPPWDYSVEEDAVVLDVMGNVRRFPLRQGPAN